ncbi:MAG: sensor histidine kinase [Candidatus Geothermincolia bacterium]
MNKPDESPTNAIEACTANEMRLQAIIEELGKFAHTVSHDLKGPLSVIQSASETLSLCLSQPDGTELETAKDLAEIIARNTDKATALIEGLLALAETGQLPSEIEDVDIADTVALIVDERSAELSRAGVTLEVPDDLGTIAANQTHMYQVFSNLISNVIQRNDSRTPVVEIRALPSEPHAHRYLVRDNGSGIPAEDLESTFEPFFRAGEDSTGIGLSTVRKIAEVYGGKVVAYNDNGTCFEITLRDFRKV